uniref:Uncharacterized protein n=1 Tax=Acrobeloides nanus TaxID=290746 RepID=A0A914E2U0_9BILA
MMICNGSKNRRSVVKKETNLKASNAVVPFVQKTPEFSSVRRSERIRLSTDRRSDKLNDSLKATPKNNTINGGSKNLSIVSITNGTKLAVSKTIPYEKTPKLGNVRRNDRLSLSIVRSPMKFTPAATKKPRRSEPASHIGREEIYVKSGLDEFKRGLSSSIGPIKNLVELMNRENAPSKKRPSSDSLNTLEEEFLASKKLKFTSTPKTIVEKPKPYFSLNFWMSKPKPWRTNFRDMQNELPSKEDRKSNLRRVILVIESLNAHSMLGDGSGLKMGGDISGGSGLPVAEGNSKPQYFLKRNLKSGKIAQKFYEKMIEQFASEKKKKNVPVRENYNKENVEPCFDSTDDFGIDFDMPQSSKFIQNPRRSLVIRNMNQPIVSTPTFDPEVSRDKGALFYLQRMVEVTFAEKEKAESQFAQAQAYLTMATQEHGKAMKKYINAKRNFDRNTLPF